MRTCYALTQCFTAEFAIRPLLRLEPEATLSQLQAWTADPSEQVRRLCSEGTRPRLPWAAHLELRREPVARILESLKQDPARLVQKSVANHLNDIGRNDPAWLLRTMKKWNRPEHPATQWIITRALRTLITEGDPESLAIIGYSPAQLTDVNLRLSPRTVPIGGAVTARFELKNGQAAAQAVLIDWVMYFARTGREASRKVFKGKRVELSGGQNLALEKTFNMTPRSTRALHAGGHRLEVQANGRVVAAADFRLTRR